jgi:hypothetical protein
MLTVRAESGEVGHLFTEAWIHDTECGQDVLVKQGRARIWMSPDAPVYVCQWVDVTDRIVAEELATDLTDAKAVIDRIRPEYI